MGKKVFKTVLKVAAVAAIAYFAPVIAAPLLKTVGVSGALAGTVGSAAIGAGLGELSGVGWKTGLMAGGLAGAGKTGLFAGKAAGTGTAAGTAGTAGTAAGTAGTTATGVTAGALPTGGVLPTGVAASGGTATLAGSVAPTTLGGQLAAGVGQGVNNLSAGLSGALGAVGLGGVNLGAVAPQLLAGTLAGGGSGAGLAAAQEAELQRAQQVNAALTQQRLDQANRLIGEAEYFDPEFMGRQAAEAAMIRGGIQETQATRGLTGERRAAEQRRIRLGTARTAGTAYQQGFGTGVQARTGTRAAGINAIPSEFPTTSAASAIAMRESADRDRAAREAGLAALFGQALGQPATQSRG